MNNYIIIHSKSLKIKLLSKKGNWSFKLSGKDWVIPDQMERLYAYLILGENNINETSGTLRANYKHITPIEIDEFVTHFRAIHPVEKVEFTWDIVPTYATDKAPLAIPNSFSYTVMLSDKQESELLEIIKTHPDSAKSRIEQWFSWYIHRYDLTPRLKRDIEAQAPELCLQFCRQHGVDIEKLKDILPDTSRWYEGTLSFLIICALFILWLSIGVSIAAWGMKFDHGAVSLLALFVGAAIILCPLAMLYERAKSTPIK